MSIYPVTNTASLSADVPRGDSYLVSFAVSWVAPDSSVPTASSPITMRITDPSIVVGDIIYEVRSSRLTAVGVATSNGFATMTFKNDPTFVVASAPLLKVLTTKYLQTAGVVPLKLKCLTARCSGVAELTHQVSIKVKKGKKTSTKEETVVLAKRSYAIPKSKSAIVHLSLTAAGKNFLSSGPSHAVRVKLAIRLTGGTAIGKAVSIS